MNHQLPSPKIFAETLAKTSLTLSEKKEILSSLPYLPDQKIISLFNQLVKLLEAEKKFDLNISKEELKFQLELKDLIAKNPRNENSINSDNRSR